MRRINLITALLLSLTLTTAYSQTLNLKKVFSKLEWFNNEKFDPDKNIEVSAVSNISDRNLSKSIKKHYKHAQRWQLANTLTSIYGYDKALKVMTEICEGTPTKELRGDVKTASIHSKPISICACTATWRLNSSGSLPSSRMSYLS